MMNFSRMQLNRMVFESRLEGLNRPTFQTNGDFLTEIGGENSTGKMASISVSTEWAIGKSERNERIVEWSAVSQSAIECATG